MLFFSSIFSPSGNTKVPTRIRNFGWNQSYYSSPFFLSFLIFFRANNLPCSSSFLFFLPFCALGIWYGINLPVLLLSIFTFVPCEHLFFLFPYVTTDNSNHNWERTKGGRWVVTAAKKRWCYSTKIRNQTWAYLNHAYLNQATKHGLLYLWSQALPNRA